MAVTLIGPPETPNIRVLAQWKQEEFTGLTGTTITLSQFMDVQSGLCLVWKNGTLLRPSLNTVAGNTVVLPSALIAGDWVCVTYKARS